MLNLYSQDPVFCRLLSVEDQWRLLYGLAISLLDYGEVLDLTAITLPFPGELQSLSLWQICDALTCADFAWIGLTGLRSISAPSYRLPSLRLVMPYCAAMKPKKCCNS